MITVFEITKHAIVKMEIQLVVLCFVKQALAFSHRRVRKCHAKTAPLAYRDIYNYGYFIHALSSFWRVVETVNQMLTLLVLWPKNSERTMSISWLLITRQGELLAVSVCTMYNKRLLFCLPCERILIIGIIFGENNSANKGLKLEFLLESHYF